MSEEKQSPSEELRAMLDERGIKWWQGNDEQKTLWESNGLTWEYFNNDNGDAWLGFLGACEQDITPEQAIAATVGAGTCHMEVHDNLAETEGMGEVWLECDECHWQMPLEPTTPRFKYCPNCRAKVVSE